jgi:polyisoprenoid-binding protein YceI
MKAFKARLRAALRLTEIVPTSHPCLFTATMIGKDFMRRALVACTLWALAACSPAEDQSKKEAAKSEAQPAAVIAPVKTEAPAGAYKLDKAHASLIFRVNHIGFSNYTARFANFDAQLQFDPAKPEASSVTATIDAKSLSLENPPPGFLNELLNPKWLDAAGHPQMTVLSTKVELTGPNTARITGDFTLKGVTLPVTMEATFNGGYAGHPYDPQARIGFSARGSLMRAQFGVKEGVPPPGSTMGVSDNVEIIIETEFNGPPLAPAAPGK